MTWFEDLKTPKIKQEPEQRISKVPEGLWIKCTCCGEILQSKILKENLNVCLECGFHFRLSAIERIELLVDENSFEEYSDNLVTNDPLNFDDLKPYRERLKQAAEKTSLRDAIITGRAKLGGFMYYLGVFEFKFMGGSMGIVVGEKVSLLFEKALQERLPVVIVSATGGARMQEGILSLMQMAKTASLIYRMRQEGIPYISILTDPTTGGVAASFAFLGDLIFAEPGALIGFAGPRVIEQTIRQTLPQGFQRSEFLLKHGFIDRIIERKDLSNQLKIHLWRLGKNNCYS
ncbi:MAG: acetyl-CoA carboxylase carboxyltransferase subunit beta [Bdellovibrio sp.]|nr:acetyl-CoA carboxylase carboxyltransferase subunit beta [Bdellovibrio sp.]